jgi:myo-inositol-1-phosphate synthase
MSYEVKSESVKVGDESIVANYTYRTTLVEGTTVIPVEEKLVFKTDKRVPKLGVMLVGWGGNNGSTMTGGVIANRLGLSWNTKEGPHKADYYGSMTQCSTVRLGLDAHGESVYIPFNAMLPMVNPNDMVIGGWDISSMNLADSMKRAKVLDFNLQEQLTPHMCTMNPLPSIYVPSFIAANQQDRADNVLTGSKLEQIATLRKNIRDFKADHAVDKVIVLWTANTERMCDVRDGLNNTWSELEASLARDDEEEVSPSTMFAVASIMEGCSYINGSPQNTFVPGKFSVSMVVSESLSSC